MQSLRDGPTDAQRFAAEVLALRALGFVANDADRLGRFVARTGASAHDLQRQAARPGFLGAVLDFILADEPTLLAFAERIGVKPEAPYDARRWLSGASIEG